MLKTITFLGALACLISCGDKGPEKEFTDAKGRHFTWKQKAVFSKQDGPSQPLGAPSASLEPLRELNEDQLSQALRPVMLRDGHEYVGDPALEVARRARSGAEPSRSFVGVPMRLLTGEGGLRTERIIGTADERKVRRDNTTYPMSTVVHLSTGCSATVVGPSTMVTAAHCVHDGTNWKNGGSFSPGADVEDTKPYPFGTHGCYTRTIPTAFINNKKDGDANYDYAVIEFSGCKNSPGNASGYKGLWVAPDDRLTATNALYVFGHPWEKNQPQIWGAGGTGSLNGSFLQYGIDTTPGQSGSGIYAYDSDGWPYVVGIHRGALSATANYGRRMTKEVFQFIIDNSAL